MIREHRGILLWMSFAVALCLSSSVGHAADGVWTGLGTGSWADPNDWLNGIIPGNNDTSGNSDAALFNLDSGCKTITVDPGRNIAKLTFDSSAPSLNINGNALLLGNGGQITMASTLTGTGITETFNAPLVLQPAGPGMAGTYSLTNRSPTSTNALAFGGSISGGNTISTVTLNFTGENPGNTFVTGIISDGNAAGGLKVVQNGTGTLILSSANTYSGGTIITKGTIQVGNGGTTGTVGNVILNGGTLAFDLAGDQTHADVIAGASGSLKQIGPGTIHLTGTNTCTVPVIINSGTLLISGSNGSLNTASSYTMTGGVFKLDNTLANSDRLKDNAPVSLGGPLYGGGVLWMTGGSIPTVEADAAGLTVGIGANTIRADANNTLSLGSITATRVVGGTLNLVTTGSGAINTFSHNDLQGIINGWNTVNGSDWAVNPVTSGSHPITAYSAYTPFSSSLTPSDNVLLTGTGTLVAGSNDNINTIKIDTTGDDQYLELNGNRLTLTDQALLFVGANDYHIQDTAGGGSLGVSNKEFILHNYGSGILTIDSSIGTAATPGSARLTITGTGMTILTGQSNFTGAVNINGGTVKLGANHGTSSGPLGSPGNSINVNGTEASLDLNGFTPGGSNQTLNLANGCLVNNGSPVVYAGEMVINGSTPTIGGSGDITVSQPITGDGTLIKSGSGNLILVADSTYTGDTVIKGGTATIINGGSIASRNVTVVAGATLLLNGSIDSVSNITINGSMLITANPDSGILARSYNLLDITNGGSIHIADATNHVNRTVVAVGSLVNDGTLNLGGNDMIIRNGNLSDVTSQLVMGYNADAGYWNGAGILSSTAASDPTYLTTLGLLQQHENGTFDSQMVGAGDILIKYTWYGDADLNGTVDATDYSLIDHGFEDGHVTGWQNGDFNYDGKINGSDYSLIDNAFNLQGSNGGDIPMNRVARPTVELASLAGATTIPEPATVVSVAICAMVICSRRRRRTACCASG